ncbi:MAG: hypothetical protein SGI71_00435 [Verrucomicrobiota bacterium]|nr:hypothetical protein [Verrucomicrobiota bacterium]
MNKNTAPVENQFVTLSLSPFFCEISGFIAGFLFVVCALITGMFPLVWFGIFAIVTGVLMGRMVDEETTAGRTV